MNTCQACRLRGELAPTLRDGEEVEPHSGIHTVKHHNLRCDDEILVNVDQLKRFALLLKTNGLPAGTPLYFVGGKREVSHE